MFARIAEDVWVLEEEAIGSFLFCIWAIILRHKACLLLASRYFSLWACSRSRSSAASVASGGGLKGGILIFLYMSLVGAPNVLKRFLNCSFLVQWVA